MDTLRKNTTYTVARTIPELRLLVTLLTLLTLAALTWNRLEIILDISL